MIEDRFVLVNTSSSGPAVVATIGSLVAILASTRRTPFQRGFAYAVSAGPAAALLVFAEGLDVAGVEYQVNAGTLLVSAGAVTCFVLCGRSLVEAIRLRSQRQPLPDIA